MFIQLEEFLLAPPLASLVSVLLVLGLWFISREFSARLWKHPGQVREAAVFLAVTGSLGALVNLLATAGLIPIWLLRSLAALVIGIGGFHAARFCIDYVRSGHSLSGYREWWAEPRLALTATIGFALFLAALGPATDADSLDYHLGVPLDWIRNGGAYARPDWFHARLVGIGEALNLLGLAAGTDNFGAMLQFSALLMIWRVLLSLCRGKRTQVLVSLLVMACPLLLFLIPNQKPQLMPAVCLIIAAVMLICTAMRSRSDWVLVVFMIAIAAGSKYSMLIGGTVIGLFAGVRACRKEQLPFFIICLALAGIVFVVPNWIRNFVYYGDPLSPLLERFLEAPSYSVVAFADNLRTTGGGTGLNRFLGLPLEWMFSPNLIVGSNVLGIGILSFLATDYRHQKSRRFVLLAILIMASMLFLGQLTARFVFESYLLFAASIAVSEWNRRKWLLQVAVTIQAVPMMIMAVYTALLLFPANFGDVWREQIMHKVAHNYSVTRWLDKVVPEDALILSRIRSNALLPRPSRSSDEVRYLEAGEYRANVSQLSGKQPLIVFVEYEFMHPEHAKLHHCNTRVLRGPHEFINASRNPIVRSRASTFRLLVLVYQDECSSPDSAERHTDN